MNSAVPQYPPGRDWHAHIMMAVIDPQRSRGSYMHVWVADCPPLQTIKAGIISQVCLRGQTSSEPCARQSLHKHHVGILELLVLRSSSTTHGRMNRSDAEAGGLHPFQKKKKRVIAA